MVLAALHSFSHTLRTKRNPYSEVHILLHTSQPASTFWKKQLKHYTCMSTGEALGGVGSGSDSHADG